MHECFRYWRASAMVTYGGVGHFEVEVGTISL